MIIKALIVFFFCCMTSSIYADQITVEDLPESGAPVKQAVEKKAVKLKSMNGLNFNVPEDWPIEKRNGAVGPIPMEEYIQLKFKKIEERIAVLEDEVKIQQPADSQKSAVKNVGRFQSSEKNSATKLGEDQGYEQVS